VKKLPRAIDYRSIDEMPGVLRRFAMWSRDVVEALRAVPDVSYVTVSPPSAGSLAVESDGTPRSVVVARVASGTVTAAPGIDWIPSHGGFTIRAVHGVTGTVSLVLRIEV
jgi:hypothetical protein